MFVCHCQLLTGLSRVASSVDEDKSLLRSQLRTAVDDLQTAANSQLQVWLLSWEDTVCMYTLYMYEWLCLVCEDQL